MKIMNVGNSGFNVLFPFPGEKKAMNPCSIRKDSMYVSAWLTLVVSKPSAPLLMNLFIGS